MSTRYCTSRYDPTISDSSATLTLEQRLFMSKGIHATWDHLANVSAASKHLMELKKRVHREMDTSYQGQSHITPDTSALVWRVFGDLKKTGIQTFMSGIH